MLLFTKVGLYRMSRILLNLTEAFLQRGEMRFFVQMTGHVVKQGIQPINEEFNGVSYLGRK